MYGELIPLSPRESGESSDAIRLEKTIVLLGRHDDCDVVVARRTVSGHHCRLLIREGYWFVRDLGSRNGTRVNGNPVDEHRLDPGDVLWLAHERFEIKYAPIDLGSVGPPPPDDVLETPEEVFGQSLLERTASGSGIGVGSDIHRRTGKPRAGETDRLDGHVQPPQAGPHAAFKPKPKPRGVLGGLLRRSKGRR